MDLDPFHPMDRMEIFKELIEYRMILLNLRTNFMTCGISFYKKFYKKNNNKLFFNCKQHNPKLKDLINKQWNKVLETFLQSRCLEFPILIFFTKASKFDFLEKSGIETKYWI